MDRYDSIARGFQEIIELISVSVDPLAPALEKAADVCTQALLSERKILCAGNGNGATVAQLFCTSLVHRLEQERPALAATCLSADGNTLAAIETASGALDVYARQVRALGQAGDVLLAVATSEGNNSLIQALRAARDRDMTAIVLSGGDRSDLASLLHPEDIEIHVPSSSAPRILEVQTMLVHCLCTLIDQALFGSFEQ